MSLRWLAAMTAVAVVGCARDPPAHCEPAGYGLRTTRSGLDWLAPAVASAKAWLAQPAQYRLQLMVDTSTPLESSIPVWSLAATGLMPLKTPRRKQKPYCRKREETRNEPKQIRKYAPTSRLLYLPWEA